jgi:hypothetical protein
MNRCKIVNAEDSATRKLLPPQREKSVKSNYGFLLQNVNITMPLKL